ncbi:phosphoribosylanthranilate isomerase [bacterium]|nr:phosphoribosylanthranilate isomerase [bacterium]PIV81604.1 MAG: N-(5'-phosphoribosyl)anthranilate isomerase [bacterium CG17_big_fil_post_rev_8_21_14_2_50_64_8]PJA76080.1 MAG: N-(5'-phosphoribosyl)anthranilate isomerase [bacterium CG_4_9_14_3_um_filter_65_15]
MTRTKICCIATVAEARVAVRHGASAIGLVSAMPSGPGVIPESRIHEIAASVPPPVATVLLTSLALPEDMIAQQKRCRVNTLQICDRVDPGAYAELRKALPGVALVQVVHVSGEDSVSEALDVGSRVDALLLDSGNQSLPVKELGGTGRTHDWALSARIVAESRVPVFLAGGLNSDNVKEAIRMVRPFGVDVCSGVRTADALDEEKLEKFMSQVRQTSCG